ncbi:2,4-dichlorophenol 6-monooxygenase [Hyaloraphidium curvatum]|nr:2,4-dichlorophenol 6-monooxygenase [Hyaloraphidium curvatum]
MAEKTDMLSTEVLVVGGGPIGLFTAYLLQRNGVKTVLCERNETTTSFPKMDITNGRSMELFRSAGLAEKIRDAAVPRERNVDVQWTTNWNTRAAQCWDLAYFNYGNTFDNNRKILAVNDGAQPLETNMRMSQVVLEPLIKKELDDAQAAGRPVTVLFGWGLTSFEEDGEGVTAVLQDKDGKERSVRCLYLAGCDGGSSRVRRILGQEKCWGLYDAFPTYTINFSTPRMDLVCPFGEQWHIQTPRGTLVSQDGFERFTMHMPEFGVPKHVHDLGHSEALRWALGDVEPFEHKIVLANRWKGHLVVSPVYGRGRVWMAGDAVHQFIPTGGYGMNSGIGDAWDLAWKLGAVVKGWGGPGLLPSIEAERRPVAERNMYGSAQHAGVRVVINNAFQALGKTLYEHSPAGNKARRRMTAILYGLTNLENEARGLEFGYRYNGSPIVLFDDEHAEGGRRGRRGREPEQSVQFYIPTTWPGSRAPHVWLSLPPELPTDPITTYQQPQTVSILDLFDPMGFTLLRFDAAKDCARLLARAEAVGMPMKLADVGPACSSDAMLANARGVYERDLVLVRPDGHVAWRSNVAPATDEEAAYVVDVVRGAAPKKPAPGLPLLGPLYRVLVAGPMTALAATRAGRALAKWWFESSLVRTLIWRLEIVSRLRLWWLWYVAARV